jgi:predicted DNA-binding transcriptional regulator AlpA
MSIEKMWDVAGLAAYFERSVRHDVLRKNWHRVPQPLKLGRNLRWRPSDVQAWVDALAADQGTTHPVIRK